MARKAQNSSSGLVGTVLRDAFGTGLTLIRASELDFLSPKSPKGDFISPSISFGKASPL
jgi:hypothetical protein